MPGDVNRTYGGLGHELGNVGTFFKGRHTFRRQSASPSQPVTCEFKASSRRGARTPAFPRICCSPVARKPMLPESNNVTPADAPSGEGAKANAETPGASGDATNRNGSHPAPSPSESTNRAAQDEQPHEAKPAPTRAADVENAPDEAAHEGEGESAAAAHEGEAEGTAPPHEGPSAPRAKKRRRRRGKKGHGADSPGAAHAREGEASSAADAKNNVEHAGEAASQPGSAPAAKAKGAKPPGGKRGKGKKARGPRPENAPPPHALSRGRGSVRTSDQRHRARHHGRSFG